MTPDDEFNRRRKSGARVTAVLLLVMVGLIFAIAWAKLSNGG
jgi:hypothetical protein